jgi:hypothetical protein
MKGGYSTLSKELVTAARARHPSLVHYLAVRLLLARTEAGIPDALDLAAQWDLSEAIDQAHRFDMLTPNNTASALNNAIALNSPSTIIFLQSLNITQPGNFALSQLHIPVSDANEKEMHEHDNSNLAILSNNLILRILDLLNPTDLLVRVAQLSKYYYKLVHHKSLGKRLLESRLSHLQEHPENPDNPQILQSFRLMQALFKDPELDSKLDWRYFKVHKNKGATRRTHPNGTQFSLPCQLPGTLFPVEMSFRIDGAFPESAQVAYTGTRLATNLQKLHADGYKYKESKVGNHGPGVYLTPSYVIDMYYYATTIIFEESLFRIVTKCRVNDYKSCWSTWGSSSDDVTWRDMAIPNIQRPDGLYDDGPFEIVAKSKNVHPQGLIITKLSDANLFYPPSYETTKHESPRWPTDPLNYPFRVHC